MLTSVIHETRQECLLLFPLFSLFLIQDKRFSLHLTNVAKTTRVFWSFLAWWQVFMSVWWWVINWLFVWWLWWGRVGFVGKTSSFLLLYWIGFKSSIYYILHPPFDLPLISLKIMFSLSTNPISPSPSPHPSSNNSIKKMRTMDELWVLFQQIIKNTRRATVWKSRKKYTWVSINVKQINLAIIFALFE